LPGSDLWSNNLNANRCKYARIYIPILWTGEKNPLCQSNGKPGASKVKNVKITQDKGVVETCDGSSLQIADTYYLEVIIT